VVALMLEQELNFENDLIKYLTQIGGSKQWQYVPDIKNTDQLWQNFKKILEQHNQGKLDQPMSPTEFAQVKQQIENLETPYQAGKFLYGLNGVSQIEIDRDDGKHVFLTVFDQQYVGAGDTVYQVVNQIVRPAKQSGRKNRRFDTTLLINGLPIIQIEEKKASHDAKEALNQMSQYIAEEQYSDIFSTLQILIGMTPDNTLYMANTSFDKFNTDFAFHWQREDDNRPVLEWRDFANRMLSIPMAHQMATSYVILDGTKNKQMIKVMRPYQVYATKRIIEKIKQTNFNMDTQKLGYVWHTTGSGKTISSFKAAWLASRLPNVDKVIFLVDRIALTQQTADNYAAYDPDSNAENKGGVVADTANVNMLSRKIRQKGGGIIVTSIQKLDRLVQRESFKQPDKHIVFIVDEAHRSTSGEMLQRAKKGFPKSVWVGYTGTPSFTGITTQSIFGNLLHAYTIREAISDHNVLGFKVDFNTTLTDETLRNVYLPEFYRYQHNDWTTDQIQYKIDHLSDEDRDDMVKSSVYDENDDHVKLVVDDIFTKWRNRSVNYRYSALLTTHVGGGKPSTPMALKYYHEILRRNQTASHPLKVAVTFSQDTSNGDNMTESNKGLHDAMQTYAAEFGGVYGDDDVKSYTESVVSRLNRTVDDGNYLDLVIVIDQLLTGFDAPYLNTLYVDRTLQGANLIQAYSRTNRIQDMQQKPYGRVINYRWPAQAEKLMKDALKVYADRNSAAVQTDLPGFGDDGDVIAPDFEQVEKQTAKIVEQLDEMTQGFETIPNTLDENQKIYQLIQQYNQKVALLKQDDNYDYEKPDELLKGIGISSDEEVRLTTTIANNVKDFIVARHPDIDYGDFDLQMEHVNEVQVDYAYLEQLIAELLNQSHDGEIEKVSKTFKKVNEAADQLPDQRASRQIKRFAKDVQEHHFDEKLVGQYPVVSGDVDQILDAHNEGSRRKAMLDFRQEWGLVDAEGVKKLMTKILDRHVTDNDDLNENNELNEIIKSGQQYYKTDAIKAEVKALPKIKYRNQLRSEFMKFANYINQEYKE